MKWISVKDKLPLYSGRYLCLFDNGVIDVFDFYIGKDTRRLWGYVSGDRVTHWMPLPEPPKDA